MKALPLLAMSAAMSALLIFASAEADAQQRAAGGGPRNMFSGHANHFSWEGKRGFHGGFGNVWIVEREVPIIVEREVVREGRLDDVRLVADEEREDDPHRPRRSRRRSARSAR